MQKPLPRGLPAIGRARLSDMEDVTAAWELCTEPMQRTFRVNGPHCIADLITKSVLAITQLSVAGDIIGFLVARDYPLIPSVHPTAWEEYIWSKYKVIELTARNTLFLHMLCWKKEYSREVVDAMLHSVFMYDSYLHYIGLVKTVISCQQLMPGSSRPEASFRRIQAMDRGIPADQLPALYLADRSDVCPRLRVRRAVEEDNDDLIPMIERHSERLRDFYGDYYISELVARHPESDRVLVVCEHREVAVGVMCLNTTINYEALEEGYDLSPYAGLRKVDVDQVCSLPKHMSELYSPSLVGDGMDTVSTSFVLDNNIPAARAPSHISQLEDDDAEHRIMGEVSHDAFINLYQDIEESQEDEFDIINIPTEYLRMPDFFRANCNIQKNILGGISTIETTGLVAEHMYDAVESYVKKKSVCPSTSMMSRPSEAITRYTGAPNAILIEICAMQEDYDERYAFDMLEAAFELFPDRDYCIICMPTSHTAFPLLEHFTLVTPCAHRMRFINESLFIAHVNSVRGKVTVRNGELSDIEVLNDLLEHVKRREAVIDLFKKSIVTLSIETYILLSQNQPIGLIIVGPTEEHTTIRTQYDLEPEPRMPGTDGTMLVGVMSGCLEPHCRWYLREILRHSRYNTLFWFCQTFAKGEQSAKQNMMSLAERMVPVRPRLSLPNITQDKSLDHIYHDVESPFAVWIIERPLTSIPKICVNNNIVLVGASRTGLAFLETLITGPTAKYLTFTNLTLVSEHGLPTLTDCLKAADTCIPQEGRYNDRYLKSVPFAFYVDIMPAMLVAIDRKKKCIYVKGGGIKYYDELVLTCGLQFQHPDYLREPLERAKEVIKGRLCERILMDNPKYHPDSVPSTSELPDNVFLINSPIQANMCFKKLVVMMSAQKGELNPENPIVVYGDCIEAYCCMQALIELGVPSDQLCFIENFPAEEPAALRVNCFNDITVDERVQVRLSELGVKQLRKARLVKWSVKHNRVFTLRLMMPMHCVKQDCFALFYFGLKAVNIHAFKAINESGLVYDGGLVVGPMFETNDPHIYGAGTFCNYSRRLFSKHLLHEYYNSEDVGEALAHMFLSKFDPFVACHPDYSPESLLPKYSVSLHRRSHPSIPENIRLSRASLIVPAGRRWQPVMKFTSPIVQSGTFPGPLYYLKVRKPGRDIPLAVQMILPHQGHTLVTDEGENYFRLQLNVLHVICAITCLSKNPFSIEIMSQLYGKHEAFFNRLLLRFQFQQIKDFFSFFIQPWMAAIYQDNFNDLMHNINVHEIGPLTDEVKEKFAAIKNINKQPTPEKSAAEIVEEAKEAERQEAERQEAERAEAEEMAAKSNEPRSSLKNLHMTKGTTCEDTIECVDDKDRGLFRSVIEEYVKKVADRLRIGHDPQDIPSECGQGDELRTTVDKFWEVLGGEKIIFSHIAKHIARNSVMNPHYAPPRPEYY